MLLGANVSDEEVEKAIGEEGRCWYEEACATATLRSDHTWSRLWRGRAT
jgi:hypothetical protein